MFSNFKPRLRRTAAAGALIHAFVAAAALVPAAASAETLFGLTDDNRIVSFNSRNPGVTLSSGAISGIDPGDRLIGLDLRPVDRKLYTMGASGTIYRLEPVALGAGGSSVINGFNAVNLGAIGTRLTGSSFGFDFNPVPDRLRVISDSNQNLRLNPLISPPGTIIDTPVTLNGTDGIDLLAVAYTNNLPGARTTVLYGLDARTGSLVRALNANAGTYVSTNLAGNPFSTLGLTIDNSMQVGFDISGGTGAAYFNRFNDLYSLDLMRGTPTLLGRFTGGNLVGLTAGAVPEPAQWLTMLVGFAMVGVVRRRGSGARVALA
jgi:hypothetical protein